MQQSLLPGLEPSEVPSQLAGTALPFAYNELDQLARIVKRHGAKLAAVVMEPTRAVDPQPGFLEGVRELCDRSGAALVFDEITAGWRLAQGGAHLRYGAEPDLAVFAKALGNGHPIAAVLGRGILAGSAFFASLAHTQQHVDVYLAAADEIFAELAIAIRQGDAAARIGGPVRHTGFARLA